MISIQNVSKKLDKVSILENLNVELDRGKIYGFVGRNGSGKSVFFKMICGFMIPDTGEILIDGESIDKPGVVAHKVRALIEKPQFIGNMSGRENLLLLASLQKKIGQKEVDELLHHFDLETNKHYSKYSLGMKQKLGIIQTIMEDPSIIILDEPFNGLDESSSEKVKKILLDKRAQGKTILLATHIKEDIACLCDEVYKVDGGHIAKMNVTEL